MASERTGPITWAQQEWFVDLGADEETPWSFAANSSAEFPGYRLDVATVLEALRDVVGRHEGLRTLIERDADGQRMQTVCTVDGLPDVVRVIADGPAADEAMTIATTTAFALAKQWPVSFVLRTDGAAVTRIGVVIDHVAVDAWGWKVLAGDLATALRARERGEVPFAAAPAVEQPLASAEWERSPDGARHARRAEAFWRRQFETLRDGLDGWTSTCGAPPAEPILRSYRLASAATAIAAEDVSAASGIRPAALYLLAFASAIAEVEGADVVGVHALTANRLTTGTQISVRKAVMPAPIVVPRAAAGTFADRLRDAAHQQMEGFRFANVDPYWVAALRREVLGGPGGTGATAARFNFLDNSVVPADVNDTSLGGEGIRFTDPAIQGRVTADPPRPGGSRYILSVQHQPAGALLTLACHEDTAWNPVAADMLRHIEAQMVWAAAGYLGAAPALR